MRLPLPVRYADYDAKGHVNNAVYLTYFEIARSRAWTEALGQPEDPAFILADAAVRFASPARVGDPLEIEVTTREVRTRAWVFDYRVTSGGRLVAEGHTTQVLYDYEGGRAVAIPDALRARLAMV